MITFEELVERMRFISEGREDDNEESADDSSEDEGS
jgi:hypothetical protein